MNQENEYPDYITNFTSFKNYINDNQHNISPSLKKLKQNNNINDYESYTLTLLRGNVFYVNNNKENLVTKNLLKGESSYEDEIIINDSFEYRTLNPYKSNFGAGLINGIRNLNLNLGAKILYLGAGKNTTILHFSNIVGENGIVYGVEKDKNKFEKLKMFSTMRKNIIPILNDGRNAEEYKTSITSLVDYVYIDINEPDEIYILYLNGKNYLKKDGIFILLIEENFNMANIIQSLKEYNLIVKEFSTLEPFNKNYSMHTGNYKSIIENK